MGLSNLSQALLTLLSLSLIALGIVTVPTGLFAPGLTQALSLLFVLFGVAGMVLKEILGSEFGTTGKLTPGQQATLMAIALFLMGVGGLALPTNPVFGFALMILGIIGAVLKEALGSAPIQPA